jgi:DNA-directed RNA polymerase specialized sigma24 family protein
MVERAGDPFWAFYDRALPEVYGYLLTRLGDASRAEAATRQAFEAIVPQWPLPANVKYEVAFAIDFARRLLADEYRRQDQRVRRRRRFAAMRSSAAAHRTTAAVELRVHWAMVALPAAQRAAMVLRHVDDLSVREVAAILGRGSRVAEFLLLRGSRNLQRALKEVARTDGFDPLVAMKGLEGPAEPREEFRDELYENLRDQLDQSAVGALQPKQTPQVPLHKAFLVVAAILAGFLLLAALLGRSEDSTGQPSGTVEPRPLSEPDTPEQNPDSAARSPSTSRVSRLELVRPPAESLGGYQFGGWKVLPASDFDGREGAAVAWTGEQLIVWGGELSGLPAERGGILNPGLDVWFSMPPAPIAPRSGATALWTGTEVLILGGDRPDGAAYDPATRLWRELPTAPMPAGSDDTAVWTGTDAILFGGRGPNGLAFNVTNDTWRSIAEAPHLELENPGAVWTGTEMIVWGDFARGGGTGRFAPANLAAYDPASDSWRQFTRFNDSVELLSATGVWTGKEVILWGTDVAGSDWRNAGLALNPATDEWRLIAAPPSPDVEYLWTPERDALAWTGSRMLVWHLDRIGGTVGPEIWAYDPDTDIWERGATSPIASDPSLIWTGETLYAYGGGDRLFRTLSLDLGSDGDELPDPVGTEILTYAHPPLPFELLAVAATSRRAAVIDLEEGIATIYEPAENLLPAAALDGAAPAGSGWMTSANGAVWSYPNGIASQPFVVQSGPSVERPGFAPAVYVVPARGDLYSGMIWIVEAGTGGSADSSLVSLVLLDNGRTISTASVVGSGYPVASNAAGLLLNVSGDSGPGMTLVTLDGSIRELWSGWGLGLSPLGRVTWLECDEGPIGCRIVVSMLDGRTPDDLVIEDSGFGSVIQPGVPQISPDGVWLVTTRVGEVDADSPPRVVLANLRDGSVSELLPWAPLGARPGPGVVWSEDGEWVFVTATGPTAIRIADGLVVELDEWIPADMEVYAVASR